MNWRIKQDNLAKQLGMPVSTAKSALKKNILFRLVQRCRMDVCFVCNKSIESADELSIEHKDPWQGRDPSLFWDIDNIAFSHLACNKPHAYGGSKLRIVSPVGYAWCTKCKSHIPEINFHKDRKRWNGLDCRCKPCVSGVNHWRQKVL